MIYIDSKYFGGIVIAPLNIVIYNVFSNHGPNIYGKFEKRGQEKMVVGINFKLCLREKERLVKWRFGREGEIVISQ